MDSVWTYAVAGIVAAAVCAYLLAAMLYPERF